VGRHLSILEEQDLGGWGTAGEGCHGTLHPQRGPTLYTDYNNAPHRIIVCLE
jgi:hypothetical protein